MSPTIPVGPYHPALEEPYKIEAICEGELVLDANILVGFNFRGIEWLAERKNYTQNLALFERVCGICSNVHTLTLSRAIETLAEVEAPPRAQHIRVIIAELERLHSHLLWAGIACELIGFKTMFMSIWSLREQVVDLLETITGNRVNHALNCPGGVNRDIKDFDEVLRVTSAVTKITAETLVPLLTTDRTVAARTKGVGVLSYQDAIAYGVVGPNARASGVEQDLRKAAPYEAYPQFEFDVPVMKSGDVYARVVVRALEILESCKIIEQAVASMPAGSRKANVPMNIPTGEACARIEGNRGEVFYYVASNGTDKPARIHVRTPTFATMPAVRLMVRGADLADVPLIQASIDPCYSCTDR
jgi:Ni,Fe-hydrogenase III large subunit